MLIVTAAVFACAVSFAACADFTGKVVGVADGDSVTVLRDRGHVKVRLVDIDAPESAQPFCNRSKQALEKLVKGQTVVVVERGKDRYQRTLGRIYRDDVDVNAEQVRQGTAWVFRQYAQESTLYALESEAKEERRGLWRDPAPIPPWEWRKAPVITSSSATTTGSVVLSSGFRPTPWPACPALDPAQGIALPCQRMIARRSSRWGYVVVRSCADSGRRSRSLR